MEHPFLPETSNGGQGAPRSPTIAVLLSAAKVSKASFFFFFLTFMAVMKKRSEHERGLDGCPPSLLPASQ